VSVSVGSQNHRALDLVIAIPTRRCADRAHDRLVSYGAVGGARAAEHLRLVAGELQMAEVRQQVALSLITALTTALLLVALGLRRTGSRRKPSASICPTTSNNAHRPSSKPVSTVSLPLSSDTIEGKADSAVAPSRSFIRIVYKPGGVVTRAFWSPIW
jgi:hypothetical protein